MSELELNLFAGEQAKVAGIEQVAEHNLTWKEKVHAIVLALPSGEFTNDDVRRACHRAGLPPPKHHNAWGAAMSGIARTGQILRVGFRKSALKSTHARIVTVWRKL